MIFQSPFIFFTSLYLFFVSLYLCIFKSFFFSRNVCLVLVKRVFAAAIFCFKRGTFFQRMPVLFSSFPLIGFCLLHLPILRYFIYSILGTGPPGQSPFNLPFSALKISTTLTCPPSNKVHSVCHVQITCNDLRVFNCVGDVMAKLTSYIHLQKLPLRFLCTQIVLWITSCVKKQVLILTKFNIFSW